MIARRDGTVVHVLAEIGRHPGKNREPTVAEVVPELAARHDPRTPPRVASDIVVVDERVVLLGVKTGGIPLETRAWRAVHVGLPRHVRRLELVDEVATTEMTRGAIRAHAEGRT